MTQERIRELEEALEQKHKKYYQDMIDSASNTDIFGEYFLEWIKESEEKIASDKYSKYAEAACEYSGLVAKLKTYSWRNPEKYNKNKEAYDKMFDYLWKRAEWIKKPDLSDYLDTEKKFFDGDILITDPCYVVRAEHHGIAPITRDDWDSCDYGYDMERLGINTYITHETMYGDWSCTVFDATTRGKKSLGDFCADAGLVSVFLLSEITAYNPHFMDYYNERPWIGTIIPDFKGTAQIVVKEDRTCTVIGDGVDSSTGETITFYSKQTGL
jgi:hypothetical protein